MLVKQISVFVENSKGKLSKITGILAKNGINLRAVSIADTTDFGILRLIVDKPDDAVKVLKENDITVKSTDVLVINIIDSPSSLHNALVLLRDNDVAVEYMYAFLSKTIDGACVIIKTDSAEQAIKAFEDSEVTVLTPEQVYNV